MHMRRVQLSPSRRHDQGRGFKLRQSSVATKLRTRGDTLDRVVVNRQHERTDLVDFAGDAFYILRGGWYVGVMGLGAYASSLEECVALCMEAGMLSMI